MFASERNAWLSFHLTMLSCCIVTSHLKAIVEIHLSMTLKLPFAVGLSYLRMQRLETSPRSLPDMYTYTALMRGVLTTGRVELTPQVRADMVGISLCGWVGGKWELRE